MTRSFLLATAAALTLAACGSDTAETHAARNMALDNMAIDNASMDRNGMTDAPSTNEKIVEIMFSVVNPSVAT